MSERVVQTHSDIVSSKLSPGFISEPLAKELMQLGCEPQTARTAWERGLERWRMLSDYRYGRQCLIFFWVHNEPSDRYIINQRTHDGPSYQFRLPAEVLLALGCVGFKSRGGITDPRLRIGSFNSVALEGMANMADQLTSRAELAAQEAEALRDDRPRSTNI